MSNDSATEPHYHRSSSLLSRITRSSLPTTDNAKTCAYYHTSSQMLSRFD